MICKECGDDLKHHALGLCKLCYKANYRKTHKKEIKQYNKVYRIANPGKFREYNTRYRRANGIETISENKQCALFLGVHVAEQVLSKVFKDVQKMPYGHKGYDFICNRGKKIDVKSACAYTSKYGKHGWHFWINKNTVADYFLCLTFDNREDLNPLCIWLIPGNVINHLIKTSIAESTIQKWDEYKLDINKVITCCDIMKEIHTEKEKDTSRPCNHNYIYSGTIASNDETEFVKTWICTKCHEKCERRSPRIGVNKPPRIVV